jgi:osmotically-inducible protein OsmY
MPPAAPVTPPDATDTGTDPADIELAAKVRKALVGDSSLTTLGKNAVVIVKAGDVTLRGKVNSAEEKTRVYDLTSAVAGVVSVDNQLEIQP